MGDGRGGRKLRGLCRAVAAAEKDGVPICWFTKGDGSVVVQNSFDQGGYGDCTHPTWVALKRRCRRLDIDVDSCDILEQENGKIVDVWCVEKFRLPAHVKHWLPALAVSIPPPIREE